MAGKLSLTALFCLLGAAVSAHAQENIDCGYPLNESERSYCADKALDEAEVKMKAAYERLRSLMIEIDDSLPEHLKGAPEALEEAQAAWDTYREKDCKAYGFPFRGGTRGNELYRSCKIVITMQRTDDLTATLEDYGN